jgi:MFS family permease
MQKSPHISSADSATSVGTYVVPELEKSAMRKFDRYAMPHFSILILIAYLDRTNIGNAMVFGFEKDLNLTGNQYGNLAMLFYVTYVAFETPWVIAIKRFGANRIIALCFVLWSSVTIGTGFIKNYHQGIAARLLLGAFESGAFPGLVFLISTIYNREEQGKRIAVLYAASALSGAFGGLIAYGIQLMGAQAGLEAWRWLFIIEGAASMVLCAICVFSIPKNAETAWFLNAAEREMMVARKQRDLIFKGDDKFSWKHTKDALLDPVLYIIAIPLFCNTVTQTGMGTFLPTIIQA